MNYQYYFTCPICSTRVEVRKKVTISKRYCPECGHRIIPNNVKSNGSLGCGLLIIIFTLVGSFAISPLLFVFALFGLYKLLLPDGISKYLAYATIVKKNGETIYIEVRTFWTVNSALSFAEAKRILGIE